MRFLSSLLLLTLLLPCVCSASAPFRRDASNVRDIYQFPKPTWIENLAQRPNGEILLTFITSPDLYQVDPFTPGASPELVHNFAPYHNTLGVAEIESDIFAVVTGNFSFESFVNIPGSYAVWKVNFRRLPPAVTKITDIPEGGLLNGITLLNAHRKTILIADSEGGVIFRLNTKTGKYRVVLEHPMLKGIPGTSLTIGVNGVRVRDHTLFFTNGDKNLFAKVPINSRGFATGPFATIMYNTVGTFDDFAMRHHTTAFITQGPGNQIAKVKVQGTETEVAGGLNSTDLAGPTSARFGRTSRDRRVLYVITNGGLQVPVNGTVALGGKLTAMDLG